MPTILASTLRFQRAAALRLVAIATFVVFLGIQLAVPLLGLLGPRPAPFGWQMYAGVPSTPHFALVLRDGTLHPIDPTPQLLVRGDLDLAHALPPVLCRHTPGARAIRVQHPGVPNATDYPCPP